MKYILYIKKQQDRIFEHTKKYFFLVTSFASAVTILRNVKYSCPARHKLHTPDWSKCAETGGSKYIQRYSLKRCYVRSNGTAKECKSFPSQF